MTFQNDIALFRAINSACGYLPAEVWMLLSLLGTGWVVFSLLLPSIVWSPRIFYAVLIMTPVAGIASRVAKVVLAAPRPPAILEPGSFILLGDALKGNSMPSGHTVIAFAAATSIVLTSSTNRRIWLPILFLLACGVGLSRIAIGIHWPEDILAGAVIGLGSGLVATRLAEKLPNKLMQPQSWWLRSLSCLGLLCVYVLTTQQLDFPENRPVQLALAAFACIALSRFWYESLKKR